MICKATKRSGGANLASHLLKNDNECILVVEIKGTSTKDLHEALKDMELTAKMTQAKTGLYHAQINPALDETMTSKEWIFAVDEMERRLGLTNQPRAVIYHEKSARPHLHVVWQRTDVEKGKVIDTKNDYYILKKLGRDLEKRFGHKLLRDGFGENWEKMNERQQTIRDGYTPKQLKARIKKLYEKHQDPKEFQQALKKAGFELAKGKRGVVLISEKNQIHSLMRYTGQKKKDIESKLEPILKSLPNVEKIKENQKQQVNEKELDTHNKNKCFKANAYDLLEKNEIGHTSAKFDKIKKVFKETEWERKREEYSENEDGLTDSRTIVDGLEKMLKKFEESKKQIENEYEQSRGLSR